MRAEDLVPSPPVPAFDASRAWLAWQLVWLTLGALLLLWIFDGTDLDREITRLFFDADSGAFPLRHTWFLEAVMHKAAKQTSYMLVAASLYFCWQGWRGRLAWLPPRNALLAAIGMLAIPIATAVLKSLTYRYCPWDIADFGGFAPYLGLFEQAPQGIRAGQCFPAGHASAGFLWLVWAVALRPAGARAARLALLAGLFGGTLFGATRMLQGAHFLSHTLWTLWLAWALSVALALVLRADVSLPALARPAGRRDNSI